MGSRSAGDGARGVPRTSVRLEGFFVKGTICIPRADPFALWLLPWVEELLKGTPLSRVMESPPWPVPVDPLVAQRLLWSLLDQGWAVPSWSADEVRIDPVLRGRYEREGRAGLARELFDAELIQGEWWMDGQAGTLLARETAQCFDWDFKRRFDVDLPARDDPQALLDAADPQLADLLRKTPATATLRHRRDRAFLAAPLVAGESKQILFTLYGDDRRLLPDELAELEPVLETHRPDLLRTSKGRHSRIVVPARSPVEQLAAEVEALSVSTPTRELPLLTRERASRLVALAADRGAAELQRWMEEGHVVRPVVGPTDRLFDALGEMCAAVGSRATAAPGLVLLASSFLNEDNLRAEDGLGAALLQAPPQCAFAVVYGHANDDSPKRQREDIDSYLRRLTQLHPELSGRVTLVAARRRSHEKVVVTSAGDWLLGSWNATSSRPGSLLFECGIAGTDPGFASRLLARLADNVDDENLEHRVRQLAQELQQRSAGEAGRRLEQAARAVRRLAEAAEALRRTASRPAETCDWVVALRAMRGALLPFLSRTRLELVDEHQTRDTLLTLALSARRDLLLASDRLAETALDPALVRDLRGDGRARRTVRVVWGREWAAHGGGDEAARAQLARGRQTLDEARESLGEMLRTSRGPMENHAKLLIADGRRGLVTSENLLSYGGEKGAYESRELGVAFWSPAVARHIQGRVVLRWPGRLTAPGARAVESPWEWLVAANEAWAALDGVRDEVEFDVDSTTLVGAAIEEDLDSPEGADDDHARRRAWEELRIRVGPAFLPWLREVGERYGLVAPDVGDRWRPYDAIKEEEIDRLVAQASSVGPRIEASDQTPAQGGSVAGDPVLQSIVAAMVRIPAGEFLMGDDRVARERPRHRVVISKPFLLGSTPVTQAVWKAVMGGLPALRDSEQHPDKPVVHVSYAEMREFLRRLNGLPGSGGFCLPTEAQWEYACRAGASGDYCFGSDPGRGDGPGMLERYAWTKRNSKAMLQRVGALEPNRWGLHDMHGLVYETVRDGERSYTRAGAVDPVGPVDGRAAIARGGFWGRFPLARGRLEDEHFRCASRQHYESSHRVSLRLARELAGESQ